MHKLALSTFKQFRFKNIALALLFLFWSVVITFLVALFFVNNHINSRFEADNGIEDFRFQNTISSDELKKLSQDYHFDYTKRYVYNETDGSQTMELLSYNETQDIDKPIIIEGHAIKKTDEVLLYDQYATSHNIKLNDSIKIKGKSFKVAGLFELPDYFNSHFLGSNKNISTDDMIVCLDESFFDKTDTNRIIIGRFKEGVSRSEKQRYSNELYKNNDLINFMDLESNSAVSLISSKIKIYKLLFILVLTILGNILAILLGLLVYSYMFKSKKDAGVLLANGFRQKDIFMWYQLFNGLIIWPTAFIGSLMGIALFHYVQPILNDHVLVTGYYNVWPIYIVIIVVLFLFHIYFSIVCTIVPFVCFVRKNMIDYFKSTAKVIKNKKTDTFLNKLPLKARFKLKIALKNKLVAFIVFFAIFSAFAQGIMMMIFYNLPSSTLNNMSESINYSQVVYTSNENFDGQYFSQKRVMVDHGKNSQPTQLLALESGENLKLISANNDLLNGKISQKNVVINVVLAKSLKLHVGDTVSLDMDDHAITDLKVVGISNINNGSYIYVDYDYFVEKNYLPKGVNGFYANRDDETNYSDRTDVSNAISANKLINEIEDNTKNLKLVGKMMLVSGILIPIALLSVSIAYLNDQTEREQRILFMNGFSRKSLMQLVLRVYDPMVLIGAFIGTVYTYLLFKLIFAIITKSTQTYYSVSINFKTVLVAFMLTVGTYALSLFLISRKKYR